MDIDGQMTIFDYLEPQEEGTEELPALHIIVKTINERFGLNLTSAFDEVMRKVVYKSTVKTIRGKTSVSVHDSEYSYICDKEGQRCVGVYFNWGYGGSGYPCDTLQDVVDRFEFFIRSKECNILET